jgi:hypothetical protein
MSCNTVTFKRGTSFAGTVTYTPDAGGPANLLTTTVTSTIVDSQWNEYPLTINMAVNGLSFVATYPDSSDWALGVAKWDIKFNYGGSIFFSDTMRLDVIAQVTE